MKLAVEARVTRANGFVLDVAFACNTDVLGIMGPSGCGKSTLLDAIAGVERGANVSLNGASLTHRAVHQRRIGYVSQDALLFPHLSVRANIAYSPMARDIHDIAHTLGLTALLDRMPRHLSGGERRRVALARALAAQPQLLLLDEPFNGLDDARRADAIALVRDLHRAFALPMVLVSHRQEEIGALATQVIALDGGRLVAPATNSPAG